MVNIFYFFINNIKSDMMSLGCQGCDEAWATKVAAFDGVCGGRLTVGRPHGCTGPAAPAAASVSPQVNAEMMAVIISSLIPVLSRLSHKHACLESPIIISTSKHMKPKASALDLPLPEIGLELRACLHDFAELEWGVTLDGGLYTWHNPICQ